MVSQPNGFFDLISDHHCHSSRSFVFVSLSRTKKDEELHVFDGTAFPSNRSFLEPCVGLIDNQFGLLPANGYPIVRRLSSDGKDSKDQVKSQ